LFIIKRKTETAITVLGGQMNKKHMIIIRLFAITLIMLLGLSSLFGSVAAFKTQSYTAYDSNINIQKIVSRGNSSYLVDIYGGLWAWGYNNYGQLGDGTTTNRVSPVKIMDNVTSVSTGGNHVFAIKSDGSLWAWGYNNYGQLGDGSTTNRVSPVKIMDNAESVAAGSSHSIVVTTDGSLWAWGYNNYGQLGDGSTTNRVSPVKIMDYAKIIAVGSSHSIVITTDGSLWAWGYNYYGQLGDGTTSNKLTPYKVLENVIDVTVGHNSTAVITTDESLWAWGYNNYGQLGDGTRINRSSPVFVMDNVSRVSTGGFHTLAIKTDGTLWAWGWNNYGQLGDGTLVNKSSPIKVMNNVSSVATGAQHSLVSKSDSSLWSWGINIYGQLGNGTQTNSNYPSMLFGLEVSLTIDKEITDRMNISVSAYNSYFVQGNSSLWGWGRNTYGQLGNGTTVENTNFVEILDGVKTVSAGDDYATAILNDGSLWVWGLNSKGQLGDGTTTTRLSPIKIMDNVISVASGDHTMAIKSDNSLWVWGYNWAGQIGDGTQNDRLSPVKIMDNVISVASGSNYSMAIKTDGSLWAWGLNTDGQLGDGTTTTRLSPVKVLENVKDIATGYNHTLAIKTDGSLWAWGNNSYGQLGDSTNITRISPVRIMDNVAVVSSGSNYSMAILIDGSLWGWGRNEYSGFVGVQNATNQTSPVRVLDNVIMVSSGTFHTMVVKTDGSLWNWGTNVDGVLGNTRPYFGTEPKKILNCEIDHDISSLNSFLLPILENAPEHYLLFSNDINAKFEIESEDIPSNFFIDDKNKISALQNGSATIRITNSSKTITYQTVSVQAYKDSPRVFSIFPIRNIMNQDYNLYISDSVSSTLNGQSFLGGYVTQEGQYVLKTYDIGGYEYVTNFEIDLTPPIITIDEYNTELTNQNITVKANTNEGVLETSTYTFTQNGVFNFVATDQAGNRTERSVTITNIDKDPPLIIGVSNDQFYNSERIIAFTEGIVTLDGSIIQTGTIVSSEGYHTIIASDSLGNYQTIGFTLDFTLPVITIDSFNSLPTNQDITVTASTNEGTLNTNSYTFTENGSFTFTATDAAGNRSSQTVTISSIDKTAPIITVNPYTLTPTNQDITVSVSTNEGALNTSSYTFSENGNFTFTATDEVGNVSNVTVIITNIDKLSPEITVNPYTLTPTNQDITVTASTNEGTLNTNSYTFTENGSFTFTATDAAGNRSSQTVTISSIDKTAPIITVNPYTLTPTNQDITVSVSTNEGALNTSSYTFSENGNFTFTATDEVGNVSNVTVIITNIDKLSPEITVNPYTLTPTNQDITVTASTNEGTLNTNSYTFTENGSFTFTATDAAGNRSSQTVTISNIDKLGPEIYGLDASIYYVKTPTITFHEGTATLNGSAFSSGTSISISGNYVLRLTDLAGNVTEKEFTVIVLGSSVTGLFIKALDYNQITLSWNPASNATGYEVYRATTSTGTYTKIATVTTTEAVLNALTFNTTNYYKVRAYLSYEGGTTYSAYSSVISGKTALKVVSNPAAQSAGYASIQVNWSAVSGASGYEVWRSTGTSTTYALVKTQTTVGFLNTALVTNTTYNFKIRAYRLVGTTKVYGAYSSVVSTKPIPSVPTISVVSGGTNALKVSWPAVAGASGYEVSYAATEEGTYTLLPLQTALSATISGLTVDAPYFVKVRAYRLVGTLKVYSGYSAIVSAKPLPLTPTLTGTSGGFDRVNLSWSAIAGAAGYELYRLDGDTYTLISDQTTLSYTDDELITGTTRSYKVVAYAILSEVKIRSLDSTVLNVTPIPSTVLGLKLSSTNYTIITIDWTDVSGASGYEISFATTSTGAASVVGDVSVSEFTRSGLTFNTTGYYRVRAYTTVNDIKVYGNWTTALAVKTALSSVNEPSAQSAGYASIHVNWSGVSGASGYEVWRSTGTSTTYALVKTQTTVGFLNTALVTNTTYNFKIRAYRLVGTTKVYGAYSSVVSTKPIPSVPSISVVSGGTNALKVSWPAVLGASGYEVSYAATEDGTYTLLPLQTATTSTISGLTVDTPYYVKVRATA
jgi:alpha-tubulin suppressor-like RCC1 family protein